MEQKAISSGFWGVFLLLFLFLYGNREILYGFFFFFPINESGQAA